MDSKETLNDFVNKNSKYFVLPDDEEKIVKYIGAEIIPNKFDGGLTDCVRYTFELSGGIRQSWDRGSRALAEKLLNVTEGSTIGIRKTGAGNKTKYSIRKID